jgi:hypothetical protein
MKKYGEISVEDVILSEIFEKKIIEFLKSNVGKAYSIQGILVNVFNVKEEDIKGVSFCDMKAGLPTLYSRIRATLKRLVISGNVKMGKSEKAFFYYWANEFNRKL